MNATQARGIRALETIEKYAIPQEVFVGGGARKLYDLEERRRKIIDQCAKEWAKVAEVPETEFWTRSLPQALFDMLNAYQVESALVAAEGFLKQHGWTVERPVAVTA